MPRITKVLIANRGEIAVRVIRAARDAGIGSVAVYADQDRDARHAQLADEAYALDGTTSADTYLVIDKLLSVARRSGADAVHPGYGFLAENADFARAVIDAGLIWIGPSPEAIERLGDKVTARHVAEKVGAPLAPGTLEPGRGRRGGARRSSTSTACRSRSRPRSAAAAAASRSPARARRCPSCSSRRPARRSPPSAAASASSRSTSTSRATSRPSASPTPHGNVVVISTRDCSLQRRHQKLVEEAPAPFLTEEQNRALYESSKAILKEVGYVGAGTCEFLIGKDGTVSFLEVNTRLQVEHPVSEEVTGIDLVREQFRIAEGGALDYDDPVAARPLDRVPHQRRGPRPQLPALARTGPRAALPRRTRRARRLRRHHRRRDLGRVRLAAREAHRHRLATAPTPSSARAAPSTSSRSPACRPCCPSTARSCATPRSPPRTATVRRLHALDRDRVRQRHRAVGRRAAEAAGPPSRAHASSSRSPASASRSACPTRLVGRASGARCAPAAARRRAARTRPRGRRRRTGDAVKAPMQATIVKVAVAEGDKVVKGDLVRRARGDEDGAADPRRTRTA